MNCPFLRETSVKFCNAAPVRKLIPLAQSGRAEEKCSSDAHTSCRVFQARPAAQAGRGLCPHLAESLMQYCGAAPVSRYVPYSESVLSRCGNDRFRYCELYLGMAHPELEADEVDGLKVPGWLRYSSNHMWLDMADDASCHVGIDSFLSRALGPVQRVSYVWTKGDHRPAAILNAAGIDLEVVFPSALRIENCNLYLRANPRRLETEPYTSGWLFEGTSLAGTECGLLEGRAARVWMEQEHRRMNQFLQGLDGADGLAVGEPRRQQGRQPHQGERNAPLAADGGLFAPGVIAHLPREQAVALFHEFFSPWSSPLRDAGGKREP
jgi:glycine cleavage system H lipoate-binding protein